MPPLKVVLITGANSGVGLATTKALVDKSTNYQVIIAARSLSKAQAAKSKVVSEVPESDSRLSVVQLDVTAGASISCARDFVEAEFGHLDALLNNAAISNSDPDISTRYKTVLDTNVIGPAVVAQSFRPLLLKAPSPQSIYVSSGAGSFARATERLAVGSRDKPPEPQNGGAYHVSKAALNMLALREHAEFRHLGLKVLAMTPGFVVSNLRGATEEPRSGCGQAGPASVAGETLLSMLEGERDADVGKMVSKDGVYSWYGRGGELGGAGGAEELWQPI